MKSIFGCLGVLVTSICYSQGNVVIHAPSTISDKEYSRLHSLSLHSLKVDFVKELDKGDIVVCVRNQGLLTISHDSELVPSIRLLRELVDLAQKHGLGKLIPFQEMSLQSQNQYRRNLYTRYPQYDIDEKSGFSLDALLGKEVATGSVVYRSATAPSSFGGGADREKKRESYNQMLDSMPLARKRSKDEIEEFFKGLPWIKESIFYDRSYSQRSRIGLERRGLELFEVWLESELSRIDAQIQAKYASGSAWVPILKGKSSRSIEDLSRISPSEHQELLDQFNTNFRLFGFESADRAREALTTARLSYRFHFTMTSSLQGIGQRFSFSPIE